MHIDIRRTINVSGPDASRHSSNLICSEFLHVRNFDFSLSSQIFELVTFSKDLFHAVTWMNHEHSFLSIYCCRRVQQETEFRCKGDLNSLIIYKRGGAKNNRVYFFKWFIRFYTITTLVSFKVLSF